MWDGQTGNMVMGPFPGHDFSLTNNILNVKDNYKDENFQNYEREIFVPQQASPWFLDLIDKILGKPPTPEDTWGLKKLFEPTESPVERAWRERLVGSTEGDKLPCMVDKDILRSDVLKKK